SGGSNSSSGTGGGNVATGGGTGTGGGSASDAGPGHPSSDAGSGPGANLPPSTDCDFQDPAQFCKCMGAPCGGDTLNDKSAMMRTVYCGTCMSPQTCVGNPTAAGGAVGICQDFGGLTPAQRFKADAMTSVWENGTPTLQYGYSQDIGDSRGY